MRHDVRVKHGAAVRDALHRIHERRNVQYAVLQEIPEARRVLARQLEGVAILDDLRQQEDAERGVCRAQPQRRLRPFVCEGRRHTDVDQRDVGPLFTYRRLEGVAVADAGRDLDARLPE